MIKSFMYLLLLATLCGCTANKNKEKESEAAKDSTRMVGNDRDEHGCIASAGYVWSEVKKDCIRVFEAGIRVESVNDSSKSAYIVFAPDSAQVELFFSDGSKNEILDRRQLPSGQPVWNIEDDDTKNIRQTEEGWTISQRGKLIYAQPTSQPTDTAQ